MTDPNNQPQPSVASLLADFTAANVRAYARPLIMQSPTFTALTAQHLFVSALIDVDTFGLRTVQTSDLSQLLAHAARQMAVDEHALPVLIATMESDTFFARLAATIWPKDGYIVKEGEPTMTLTMLRQFIVESMQQSNITIGLESGVADAITALVAKALIPLDLVYMDRGWITIELPGHLLPTWATIKQEAVARHLQVILESMRLDTALRNQRTSSRIFFAPLAAMLTATAAKLHTIRAQWNAIDALAAGSLLTLSQRQLPPEYRGLDQLPAVQAFNANFTLVTRAKEYFQKHSLEAALQRAPTLLLTQTLPAALSSITESGRLRQVQLAEFVSKTEIMRLCDQHDNLLAVMAAPAISYPSVAAQISLVGTPAQMRPYPMTPMHDAEKLATPLIQAAAAMYPAPLAGLHNALATAYVSDDDGTSDVTAYLFGMMLDEAYIEHVAAALAESVSVSIDASTLPEFRYAFTPRHRDPLGQLQLIAATAYTDDPAVVLGWAVPADVVKPAESRWVVGPQTLAPELRGRPLGGRVMARDGVIDEASLIPDSKSTLTRVEVITLQLPGIAKQLTTAVNVAELLTGMAFTEFEGDKTRIYAHQLPAVRQRLSATLALVQHAYSRAGKFQTTFAPGLVASLQPFMQTPAFKAVHSQVKLSLLSTLTNAPDRRTARLSLTAGTLDAELALRLVALLLTRLNLIPYSLSQKLADPQSGIWTSDAVISIIAESMSSRESMFI